MRGTERIRYETQKRNDSTLKMNGILTIQTTNEIISTVATGILISWQANAARNDFNLKIIKILMFIYLKFTFKFIHKRQNDKLSL